MPVAGGLFTSSLPALLFRRWVKIKLRMIVLAIAVLVSRHASAMNCGHLAQLQLPDGVITLAEFVPPGSSQVKRLHIAQKLPAFCRIAVTLRPSSDSNIRIEVWLPIAHWNGKYEGTGNGGYAGSIDYSALSDGLRRGFAVANTDMGTSPATARDGDALAGHPEKWADWGWRSTHVMTTAARQIIHAYYGKGPQQSYFVGCSTGGEQALMEAQRFPDDYQGIVAGAPANARTHVHMSILWNFTVSEEDGILPPGELAMITRAVLSACPKLKAVPSDGFFSGNPYSCHWSPRTLLCRSSDSANCLTARQVAAVEKIYGGPRNPVTDASIYPGVPRGSEFGWSAFVPSSGSPPLAALFRWVFGANWKWRTFDFNRDVTRVDAQLAPTLNATNPNLDAFRSRGGKLIMFHGLDDWRVAPGESIEYYENVAARVAATQQGRNGDVQIDQFYRLFLVPGMAHCSGGPGLNHIDALPALESWVEKGIAPNLIVARRAVGQTTRMTRPVCPYPEVVNYRGGGDTNIAANFSCIQPAMTGMR